MIEQTKVCYFYAEPFEEAVNTLTLYAPGFEQVFTGADGFAYWEEFKARWDKGYDLVSIEQDIEIHEGVIESFEECPGQWCIYLYPVRLNKGLGYQGCMRFRKALQAHVPAQRISPSGRLWQDVSLRVYLTILKHGYEQPHVHGEVKHHHDYSNLPIPGWTP